MTVSNIFSRKRSRIALIFTLFVSLYSCGTYQSAYNDDGIYGSNNQKADEEIVIVEKSEFDKNYFTRQLDEIQNIGEEDVFTDIDDYYYEDTYETDELNNSNNQPWEYTDNITINIDAGYGSNGYYWHNPFYYNYSYNYYPYYYNYYSPWRSYRPWYYNGYYGDYYAMNYGNYPYYGGYRYYNPFRYNRYNNGYYPYNNYANNYGYIIPTLRRKRYCTEIADAIRTKTF